MNRFITLRGRPAHGSTGFSLIEVLVAVVILATGLLALAALQGALARNSADAKARSAVMAALTSRMSEIRQAPPTAGTTTWTTSTLWVGNAAVQAGTNDLKIVESIQEFRWDGTAFIDDIDAVPNPLSAFTRATLQATWTAANGNKALALSSDLSGVIYGDGAGYPVIDPTGSASKRPVVRQADPGLEAGVIPIAYGTGDDARSTAASNPKPVLIGSTTVVGTQFDVLTYVPEGGNTAIIRRRIDTNLVKCRCTTGLSTANRYSVAGVAQWPTVWDGDKYATYQPADKSIPPSEALKAGEDLDFSGKKRSQSSLCTECCRDRIDSAEMPVKFGPEGEMTRYDLVASVLVPSVTGNFVAACRVIGNEGIYKTAADIYQRQFGLLATQSAPATSMSLSDLAKDGRPTKTATDNYGDFVKQYLTGYLTSIGSKGEAPTSAADAQIAFNAFNTGILNNPTNIPIPGKSSTDARYMHARALYSDFLTATARTRISKVLEACPTSTAKIECLLPHLPFTTINMTELATWSAGDDKLEVIKAGTLLGTSVMQPFGGRTTGIKETPQSYANVSSSLSNSTLAFRLGIPYVNASEANSANWLTDRQQFSVGTSGGPSLPYITVVPQGLLTESPISQVTVNLASPTSSCAPGSSSYRCDTASLPGTVGLVVSNYNRRETVTANLPAVNVVCGTKTLAVGRPFQITYSGISVSLTEGGASIGTTTYDTTARSIPQTATWGSTTLNSGDALYLTFLGGERQCPTTASCKSGNKFNAWGTTYTAEACAIETYRP